MFAHFDGGIEAVHVDVDDAAGGLHGARLLADRLSQHEGAHDHSVEVGIARKPMFGVQFTGLY